MGVEIRALRTPPQVCLGVCLAALHVLAGSWDAIPVKRNGTPKKPNWDGCREMLGNTEFIPQLRALPALIDNGRLSKERMDSFRQQIQDIVPESQSDAGKIASVRCCSLMCQMVLQHLICVRNYYDNVAELSERFGGTAIAEFSSETARRSCP